jgi:hypothetical protein
MQGGITGIPCGWLLASTTCLYPATPSFQQDIEQDVGAPSGLMGQSLASGLQACSRELMAAICKVGDVCVIFC